MRKKKKKRKNKNDGYLSRKRTYLAGPMEHVTKTEAVTWRDNLTKFLKGLRVKVFDPCKSQEEDMDNQREYIKALKKARRFEALHDKMKRVVRQDLRCVDIVDFMIVYLPPGVRSTGAIHELIVSDLEKKPTLLVCEDMTEIPDWIYGILPLRYMFDSFESLMEYLKLVNRGFIKDDPRWQFME